MLEPLLEFVCKVTKTHGTIIIGAPPPPGKTKYFMKGVHAGFTKDGRRWSAAQKSAFNVAMKGFSAYLLQTDCKLPRHAIMIITNIFTVVDNQQHPPAPAPGPAVAPTIGSSGSSTARQQKRKRPATPAVDDSEDEETEDKDDTDEEDDDDDEVDLAGGAYTCDTNGESSDDSPLAAGKGKQVAKAKATRKSKSKPKPRKQTKPSAPPTSPAPARSAPTAESLKLHSELLREVQGLKGQALAKRLAELAQLTPFDLEREHNVARNTAWAKEARLALPAELRERSTTTASATRKIPPRPLPRRQSEHDEHPRDEHLPIDEQNVQSAGARPSTGPTPSPAPSEPVNGNREPTPDFRQASPGRDDLYGGTAATPAAVTAPHEQQSPTAVDRASAAVAAISTPTATPVGPSSASAGSAPIAAPAVAPVTAPVVASVVASVAAPVAAPVTSSSVLATGAPARATSVVSGPGSTALAAPPSPPANNAVAQLAPEVARPPFLDDSDWPRWLPEAYDYFVAASLGVAFMACLYWWAALERLYGFATSVCSLSFAYKPVI